MFAAYLTITIVTIAAITWATIADLVPLRFVLATMHEVGVPQSWLTPLGVVKGTGVVGLLIGLLGVRPLGVAAAVGLVLFFIGALVTHARARVFYNIAVPAAYFALAVASTVLAIAVL